MVPFETTRRDLSNEGGFGAIGYQHRCVIRDYNGKKVRKCGKNGEKVWKGHNSGQWASQEVRMVPKEIAR